MSDPHCQIKTVTVPFNPEKCFPRFFRWGWSGLVMFEIVELLHDASGKIIHAKYQRAE